MASHYAVFGAQGRLTEKVTQGEMQMFLRASICPVLLRKAGRRGSFPALPAGQALEALSRGLLISASHWSSGRETDRNHLADGAVQVVCLYLLATVSEASEKLFALCTIPNTYLSYEIKKKKIQDLAMLALQFIKAVLS